MASSSLSSKSLAATGVILLVIGIVFLVIPQVRIQGFQEQLRAYPQADPEWRSRLQGWLNQEINMQLTFYNPVASLLFASGIAMVAYSIVSKIIQ